jgi:ADP-ribose pyrophosphatase
MGAFMFTVTSSTQIYTNKWIEVREDKVIRPDGNAGTFGVVRMAEGSTVLPIDSSGEVTLVREYKYGVGRYTLEAVSGGIDPGETPLRAAQRELAEELGLDARDWTHLGVIDPFTSVVRSPNHMFLATSLTAGTARNDPGEVIVPVRMPFEAALTMVMAGDITHGASCVLILKAAQLMAQTRG